MTKKKVKVVKKTRTQKGRGQTYEEWYNTPDADLAKQRARDYGDTSQLDDMRAYLGHFRPKDILEPKYNPETELQRYIRENHIVSSSIGALAGIASNVLFPGSGAVTGPALKMVLQQMGYGMKNTRVQHGRGSVHPNLTQSFQQNPIMCSPNSNSYGGMKF